MAPNTTHVNSPARPMHSRLALLAGSCSVLVFTGCAPTGAQKASVQPRGEVAALIESNAAGNEAAGENKAKLQAPGTPRSRVNASNAAPGNPMPVWVAAEAEKIIAQNSVPFASAQGNAVSPTMNKPEMTTRAVATEESTTLTDGMEGLARVSFAEEGADFDPVVSRDGKFMVFASTQHRPTSDIYIKRIDGRTVTQLTADPGNDIMPAISPKGDRVAFASDRSGSWKIYVMSAQGGQAVQLTSDSAMDLHPTWSPDGTRLAFCRLGQMSGRWELWVLNAAQPANVEFLGYGMFPEWCPVAGTGENASDKIIFQRGRERGDRAFGLWSLDYKPGSASNLTEIVSSRGYAAINPSWSPDGKWVAYSRVEAGKGIVNGNQRADLWIASITGGGRVNLSGGRYSNVMPTWSSDGRVYFVSDRGGVDNIWSVGMEKALAAASAGMDNSATASASKSASSAAANEGAVAPNNSEENNNSGTGVATVPTTP